MEKLSGGESVFLIAILGFLIFVGMVQYHVRKDNAQFLEAGCEEIIVPGKSQAIWSNCKNCKIEK